TDNAFHERLVGSELCIRDSNEMVEFFGQNLSGYLFSKNGWVQSYGMRGVKPPIIWGDVTRLNPISVKWSSYAQSRTNKPVK
ncbi:hypothetical protein ACE1AM_10620, partial [Streptococcus pneumoniae]|uniref:hypothetical protein n=1 Tax=Streptococcus pneumoniae TaxID=1313 RepID=UPI0035B6D27D